MLFLRQSIVLISTLASAFGRGSRSGYGRSTNRSSSSASEVSTIVAEKESNRNSTIPFLEATTIDGDDRLLSPKCDQDEGYLQIVLTTDDYGFETSWTLETRKGGEWVEIESGPPDGTNYADNTRYIGQYCLKEKDEPANSGRYRFKIMDLFSDGICCGYGSGSYAGYVNGAQQFSSPEGDSDWSMQSHRFTVTAPSTPISTPTPSPSQRPTNEPTTLINRPKIVDDHDMMTDRDHDWLESHNSRRQYWHELYNKTYVPLSWSNSLSDEAKVWAEHLLSACEDDLRLYHDPATSYGENVAGNAGTGSWGRLKSTEAVLSRFVEMEEDKSWPKNGHLTQVLWRSSKYVGCADASKPKEGGGMCHTQVCRYARPGNCNMNHFKKENASRDDGSRDDAWWLEPMLADDSGCLPLCPPGGC